MSGFYGKNGNLPEVIPVLTNNIRTGKDNYTWGRPAHDSKILTLLNLKPQDLKVDENEPIAELWLASDDSTYSSEVKLADGNQVKLSTLLQQYGDIILGQEHIAKYGPWMATIMKCIDAQDSLSVQVHPAMGNPTRPAKPEMWMPESSKARLYLGFNQDISAGELRKAYIDGNLESLLCQIDAGPEDLILVGGALIHAIRGDTTIWEWSHAPTGEEAKKGDLKRATVSPWDRTDGKQPRPNKENIDETVEILNDAVNRANIPAYSRLDKNTVFNYRKTLYTDGINKVIRLFETPEVIVEEVNVGSALRQHTYNKGHPLFVREGSIEVVSSEGNSIAYLPPRSCAIISSAIGKYTLVNTSGKSSKIIRWYAPLDTDLKSG